MAEPLHYITLHVTVALSSFRRSSLYEQDEANVFAEPSVMAAHVLPYLLRMAEKSSESSAVAQRLSAWAEESAAQVRGGLAVCKELQPGDYKKRVDGNHIQNYQSKYLSSSAETLTPAWLALLVDPRFHGNLCGLVTRAAFLLRLSNTSDDVRRLCDPSALQASLQDVCNLLCRSGVHFHSAVTAAVAGELRRNKDDENTC